MRFNHLKWGVVVSICLFCLSGQKVSSAPKTAHEEHILLFVSPLLAEGHKIYKKAGYDEEPFRVLCQKAYNQTISSIEKLYLVLTDEISRRARLPERLNSLQEYVENYSKLLGMVVFREATNPSRSYSTDFQSLISKIAGEIARKKQTKHSKPLTQKKLTVYAKFINAFLFWLKSLDTAAINFKLIAEQVENSNDELIVNIFHGILQQLEISHQVTLEDTGLVLEFIARAWGLEFFRHPQELRVNDIPVLDKLVESCFSDEQKGWLTNQEPDWHNFIIFSHTVPECEDMEAAGFSPEFNKLSWAEQTELEEKPQNNNSVSTLEEVPSWALVSTKDHPNCSPLKTEHETKPKQQTIPEVKGALIEHHREILRLLNQLVKAAETESFDLALYGGVGLQVAFQHTYQQKLNIAKNDIDLQILRDDLPNILKALAIEDELRSDIESKSKKAADSSVSISPYPADRKQYTTLHLTFVVDHLQQENQGSLPHTLRLILTEQQSIDSKPEILGIIDLNLLDEERPKTALIQLTELTKPLEVITLEQQIDNLTVMLTNKIPGAFNETAHMKKKGIVEQWVECERQHPRLTEEERLKLHSLENVLGIANQDRDKTLQVCRKKTGNTATAASTMSPSPVKCPARINLTRLFKQMELQEPSPVCKRAASDHVQENRGILIKCPDIPVRQHPRKHSRYQPSITKQDIDAMGHQYILNELHFDQNYSVNNPDMYRGQQNYSAENFRCLFDFYSRDAELIQQTEDSYFSGSRHIDAKWAKNCYQQVTHHWLKLSLHLFHSITAIRTSRRITDMLAQYQLLFSYGHLAIKTTHHYLQQLNTLQRQYPELIIDQRTKIPRKEFRLQQGQLCQLLKQYIDYTVNYDNNLILIPNLTEREWIKGQCYQMLKKQSDELFLLADQLFKSDFLLPEGTLPLSIFTYQCQVTQLCLVHKIGNILSKLEVTQFAANAYQSLKIAKRKNKKEIKKSELEKIDEIYHSNLLNQGIDKTLKILEQQDITQFPSRTQFLKLAEMTVESVANIPYVKEIHTELITRLKQQFTACRTTINKEAEAKKQAAKAFLAELSKPSIKPPEKNKDLLHNRSLPKPTANQQPENTDNENNEKKMAAVPEIEEVWQMARKKAQQAMNRKWYLEAIKHFEESYEQLKHSTSEQPANRIMQPFLLTELISAMELHLPAELDKALLAIILFDINYNYQSFIAALTKIPCNLLSDLAEAETLIRPGAELLVDAPLKPVSKNELVSAGEELVEQTEDAYYLLAEVTKRQKEALELLQGLPQLNESLAQELGIQSNDIEGNIDWLKESLKRFLALKQKIYLGYYQYKKSREYRRRWLAYQRSQKTSPQVEVPFIIPDYRLNNLDESVKDLFQKYHEDCEETRQLIKQCDTHSRIIE